MAITFQAESFEQTLPEFSYLLPQHWEELALQKDKVPLSPQFDIYFERERNNHLIFVTARDEGEIVGYFIGFIAQGLHYSTCKTCHLDIFYIRKDYRKGRMGIRLFKFVEEELKKRGVQRWFVSSKLHADASALFKYLKFEPIELHFSKWIGEE